MAKTYCYGCGKDSDVEYCSGCRATRIAALKEAIREWEGLIAFSNDPAPAKRHLAETQSQLARLEAENV